MTSIAPPHPPTTRSAGTTRVAGAALVLAGVTFSIAGATHPTGSGTGSKARQLHDMMVDSSWYPSHAVMLASMALVTCAVGLLRRHADGSAGFHRLLTVVLVVSGAATASMVVHLFAALDADALAAGRDATISRVQAVNEAIDAAWGSAVAALALVGGLTRRAGNLFTIPFGVVGGVAFALASATIPYTDALDPLFPVSSLISVWAIMVGGLALLRHPA